MKDEMDPSRRESLKLIGMLGASATIGFTSDSSGSNLKTDQKKFKEGRCLPNLELPHTASTAVDIVTTHAVSELSNDLDTILTTISAWDQHYAVLLPQTDGSVTLRSAFTQEEVQQYYATNVAAYYNPGGERRLYDLLGRWYDLIDTRYSIKVLPDGPTLTDLRGVFLFITWPDGVIGEIYWSEPSWATTFDIEAPRDFTDMLNAYEDTWRLRDIEARLALIEEETCSVIRFTDVFGIQRSRFVAKTKDELRYIWSAPEMGTMLEFERVHHVVSTYYIFAAYRMVLEISGEKVLREIAMLLPIGPNRKFVGELSYSFEKKL